MFLIFLLSVTFSKEKRIHRKPESRKHHTKKDLQDFEDFGQPPDQIQQFDDFDSVPDQDSQQKSKQKGKQSYNDRKYQKVDNYEDDYQNNDPGYSPYNHAYKLKNGTLVCERGYTAGRVITEKGCWKCSDCTKQEICAYPGKCIVPVPQILDVKQIDKKSNIRVTYSVDSRDFKPQYAYCMVNNVLQKAPFVTSHIIPCAPPTEDLVSIMVSFDKFTWSNPIMNPLEIKAAINKRKAFIIAGCTLAAVIIIIILYFASKRRRNLRYPVRREARQILRFPQSENQEVVYASSKQPY